MDEQRLNNLISLLNEKEVLLKEKELALEDQQEEFLSQKEELNAAVEELIAKNNYLTATLEQLKQRNQELDHILYRASHDLKTPVSSIYGLIEILRSEALSDDQQLATTHLQEQARQMELRLLALTNLSLAFFTQPRLKQSSINELFMNVWRKINHGMEMHLFLLAQDQHIHTDPDLFSIAISCLLENSIHFRSGTEEGQVKINCSMKNDALEIEICDNGDGVDSRVAPRIFDMFYRGSEKSKGFGLGLYIARIIMEKLNGNIAHVPQKGATVFRLIHPA